MIYRFWRGWMVFFELYAKQRRKKHGAGRAPFLQAVYCAACGQAIVDHLRRRKPKMPAHAKLAQFLEFGLLPSPPSQDTEAGK